MRKKITNQLCNLLLSIATLSLIINVSFLLYGVIARYLLGHSPIWMDELSRYLVITMVLLTLAPAWLYNKHMKVDFIDTFLPKTPLRLLKIYIWLLTLSLSGYIAWYSFQYALSISRFTTIGLGISKSIPLMSLPLGFTCLFLVTLLTGPNTNHCADAAR